ncbi:hypothetical protein CDL15_Pgr021756 [Punica granatum]|uniref:Uncharacterized protein n=1 Tax=Punica granatum TaxID=22663 RepID=A0A218WUF0_PUNGR|nr:hypothetical protein CDL15_Pgr021756 [Punica granatum]
MNDLVCNRAQPVVKKAKKKQIVDEVDRLKQAEKKRCRLEKALATSAAIRSELEKKKQRKKEQQKLDEEGAAIAEAVALHVLGEDADETCDGVCDKDDICGEFFRSCQIESLPCWKRPICSLEKIGWACDTGGSKFIWGGSIDDEAVSSLQTTTEDAGVGSLS